MKKYKVKTLIAKDDDFMTVHEYGTKKQAFDDFNTDVRNGVCYSLLTEETETDCYVLSVFTLYE